MPSSRITGRHPAAVRLATAFSAKPRNAGLRIATGATDASFASRTMEATST